MSEVKKRDGFVDTVKAIGIVIIVLYHVYDNEHINKWFSVFQIVLFFFIGGYLFKEISLSDFIKRKTKGLLLPYFIFGAITLVYYFIIERRFRPSEYSLIEIVINGLILGKGKYLYYNFPLWFLSCYFVTLLFYLAIFKVIKSIVKGNNRKLEMYLGFIIMVLYFLSLFFKMPLDLWTLNRVPRFLLYYYLGYLFCRLQCKEILISTNIIVLYGTMLFSLVLSFGFYFLEFNEELISITALIGIVIIAILLRNFDMSIIGKRTMIVLCIHAPIYRAILYIVSLLPTMAIEKIRKSIILSLIIVAITLVIIIGIDNTYFYIKSNHKKRIED